MANYTGRIDTKRYELEDRLHNCKDNRIYVFEYGNKIARVCEVNKNTGEIYRTLCCKIDSDEGESLLWIRKRLAGVRGIREKSLK